MKKCSFFIIAIFLVAILSCNEKPVGPVGDDQVNCDSLFVPIQSIPIYGGSLFVVYLGCLRTALDAGKKPFARGAKWEKGAKLFGPADIWDELYFVFDTLIPGGDYTIGFGTQWNGNDNNSLWLGQLAKGNKFFNEKSEMFHFSVSYYGEVVPK